jgi:hypothetical protein
MLKAVFLLFEKLKKTGKRNARKTEKHKMTFPILLKFCLSKFFLPLSMSPLYQISANSRESLIN